MRRYACGGEFTITSSQRLVNRPMLCDRSLERRACSRGAEREGVPGVRMDGADDRSTDLAARGPHDDRMECEVESPELVVRLDRIRHPFDVVGEEGKLILAQAGRRSARHLLLQQQSGGDQVVEEHHLVVVRKSDPEHGGIEQVPRVPLLNPRSATLLNPNESSLLEQLQPFSDDGATEAELLAQNRLGG
jgi:hypothetical protein